jgi:hypothetical protein
MWNKNIRNYDLLQWLLLKLMEYLFFNENYRQWN